MLGRRSPSEARGLEKEFKSMTVGEREEDSRAIEGKQFDADGDEEMDVIGTGGTPEDNEFDEVVGALEHIMIDPAFSKLQNSFCRKHCQLFDNDEENKLCYTEIFDEYTDLVEGYIESRLRSAIAGFRMDRFARMCRVRKEEITGDVFELLLSLGDFSEFKHLMLSHKAALNGNSFECIGGWAVACSQ